MRKMPVIKAKLIICFSARSVTPVKFIFSQKQQFIDRYDNPEWECPGVVVVWGNNPVVANSDGAYGHWVTDVLQRGAKLLVVDPRLTWLAAHADVWCRVRPGSDHALALGIANVMITERIYDVSVVSSTKDYNADPSEYQNTVNVTSSNEKIVKAKKGGQSDD